MILKTFYDVGGRRKIAQCDTPNNVYTSDNILRKKFYTCITILSTNSKCDSICRFLDTKNTITLTGSETHMRICIVMFCNSKSSQLFSVLVNIIVNIIRLCAKWTTAEHSLYYTYLHITTHSAFGTELLI